MDEDPPSRLARIAMPKPISGGMVIGGRVRRDASPVRVQVRQDGYRPQHYHRLAKNMGKDKNLAIFRRFDAINLMQLMALQTDIVGLQRQFEASVQSFNSPLTTDSPGETTNETSGNFHVQGDLSSPDTTGRTSGTHTPHLQKNLLDGLANKMKEYNSLLLQVVELSKLGSPPKSQLKLLKGSLVDKEKRPRFAKHTSFDFSAWDDENKDEYISLNSAQDETYVFSRFVSQVVAPRFHSFVGEKIKVGTVIDEEANLWSYSDSRLSRASNIVALVLSSVLPVMTIFVLNTVNTTNQRIGLTMLFTAVFAVLLANFSNAKTVEIFGATATFAAIEVVFIGSAIGQSGS